MQDKGPSDHLPSYLGVTNYRETRIHLAVAVAGSSGPLRFCVIAKLLSCGSSNNLPVLARRVRDPLLTQQFMVRAGSDWPLIMLPEVLWFQVPDHNSAQKLLFAAAT